jgi:hypothetical protein
MPVELALRLVTEAAALGKFSSVGFTGGEALVYPDEIFEIASRIKAVGLEFTVATAAHWGKSESAAERIVHTLAANGLRRLNISYDPSHARFIPKKSILNAIHASSSAGIPTYVVGTFYSAADSMESYLPESIGLPKVNLVTKYVAGVGRASSLGITQSTYGLSLGIEDFSCYRRVFHDMVVWFDGTVYPCCSTFNRDTPGIAIGNVHVDSLETLYGRLEGSLMFRVMKRKGFQRLYEIVREYDPVLYDSLPVASDSVGPCSLCNKLFSDSAVASRVRAVFECYEKDRLEDAMPTLLAILGEDKVRDLIQNSLREESC